jgi:hypothetical protein
MYPKYRQSTQNEMGIIHLSLTFGTIFQRSLDYLGVRMHYGHPDFMDGFWASNRGSTSKASPSLNVSEDMCAGLNLWGLYKLHPAQPIA